MATYIKNKVNRVVSCFLCLCVIERSGDSYVSECNSDDEEQES